MEILKNNEQRKAFLKTFREWPVWFEVPQAEQIYYRLDLEDESSIVICEQKIRMEWKAQYTKEDPEGTTTTPYLLIPGYHHLADCRTSETVLVEHLKNYQKGIMRK